MSRFFNQKEEYAARFYQVPVVFFTSDRYAPMSSDAKLAYALLHARHSLSVKNSWIDKEGNFYFIFSNAELRKILNCSVNTVTKIRKELLAADLIFVKKRGQGKKDWLYLKKPEVTDEDVYKMDAADELEPETVDMPKNHKICDSGIAKNEILESQNLGPISKNDLKEKDLKKDDDDDLYIARAREKLSVPKNADLYVFVKKQIGFSDPDCLLLLDVLDRDPDFVIYDEEAAAAAAAKMPECKSNPVAFFAACYMNELKTMRAVARDRMRREAEAAARQQSASKAPFYNWLEERDDSL